MLADAGEADPFRRKASLQGEQIELRLAVERGDLLPANDVRDVFAEGFKVVRLALETLPDVLERDAALTPVQVAACERVLDKTREELHGDLQKVKAHARKRR